jgi:hypothetical protein
MGGTNHFGLPRVAVLSGSTSGAQPMLSSFTPTGLRRNNGRHLEVDTVPWCTGFRPDLGHLRPRGLTLDGAVPTTIGDPPTGVQKPTTLPAESPA